MKGSLNRSRGRQYFRHCVWPSVLFLACSVDTAGAAPAETIVCHLTYGGETTVLRAAPVDTAYGVGTTPVGSYFQFRVVFQSAPPDQAAIRIVAYADRDEGMTPVHQATHPYPPAPDGRYGFTGLNAVYEPVRDGELQYWCSLEASAQETAR